MDSSLTISNREFSFMEISIKIIGRAFRERNLALRITCIQESFMLLNSLAL